jgi:hypothetical protein
VLGVDERRIVVFRAIGCAAEVTRSAISSGFRSLMAGVAHSRTVRLTRANTKFGGGEETSMKWLALIVISTVGALAPGADKPESKRHVYLEEELYGVFNKPPADAKADWRPSTRMKADDTFTVIYPFAKKDMDGFFCSSDNADVRLYVWEDEKGLRVGVDTGKKGKGKKATAKVSWTVVEVNGREHQWSMDVVFE